MLWGLLIEVPAFVCALLRLFSRWHSTAHFETDDYVMIIVTGIWVPFEIIGQLGNLILECKFTDGSV